MSEPSTYCPNCGGRNLSQFYRCDDVPAHSMVLLHDRQEAERFPTGRITLAFCGDCAFITNTRFDPALEQYGADYEASQSFSNTFNAFHRKLAGDLIERYGLHGKEVMEIGCGQGEFLQLLCEMGGNTGIGFDPAYTNAHGLNADDSGRTRVIADYYSEAYGDYAADFVCCKQTLEHIPNTAEFVRSVRRAIGDRPDTHVFFQVPDFLRIMQEGAFWDVYYEHCSYFTRPSLSYVFRREGFDVLGSRVEYGDQYLMVEAKPGSVPPADAVRAEGVAEIAAWVRRFARNWEYQVERWRHELAEAGRRGQRTALWGGGSKAVAFLTTLGAGPEVAYAVDINPRKQGAFLAGRGHPVVGPEHLKDAPPDRIIVMNPIYMDEIRADLDRLGLNPTLLPVTAFTETCETEA
ncbi:class I SAM-dependent methyltransferase [Ferruginivarius sediminum]|nr:class I SAM-dependent methyltransferase [Ferruginivarius sediminum]